MTELQSYLEAWRHTASDLDGLLRELDDGDWGRPTDCPGWTVRDVVAHLAAIEHELATGEGPAGVDAGGGREVVPSYTQAGVDARSADTPAQLVAELRSAFAARDAQLTADPPTDPSGSPVRRPGGIDWNWRVLLRNRLVDLWVHEQDIRRATGRPGGMTTPSARIALAGFSSALPYVIGKRAHAEPGTVVQVEIDGSATTYVVDDDGRCAASEEPLDPQVRLAMSRESFLVLAAGRKRADELEVTVEGDRSLGRRILDVLPLTP